MQQLEYPRGTIDKYDRLQQQQQQQNRTKSIYRNSTINHATHIQQCVRIHYRFISLNESISLLNKTCIHKDMPKEKQ